MPNSSPFIIQPSRNFNLHPGNLFVIAAPSGTGKTSLVHAVANAMPNVIVSISYTTRPIRPGEVDGVNYHFVTNEQFNQLRAQNDFLESATIFDHQYGTSKNWVNSKLNQYDVILEIDWQGHAQIKQIFPQTIGIFILPPSFAELKRRLISRNPEQPAIIQKRLTDARETVHHINAFDYIVVNSDFGRAQQEIQSIIRAYHLQYDQQSPRLTELINELSNSTNT